MEGTRVRRLEERDIDAAIALTDLEGWGYTPSDFRRLLFLAPSGCFAAEHDGRVVGVLTTTRYGGLAFLGAVIVLPELRGKGVGNQMMEAALAYLGDAGATTVRLNAYLNAVRFYERLGFQKEYEVIRWHGPAAHGPMRGIRPVRLEDVERLTQLDARYFGANRHALLDRLREEFPSTFLVAAHGDALRGFIVGNPSGDSCEIGPWVVESTNGRTARDLFHGLVAAAGVGELAFSGPSRNPALLQFVREMRFSEVFRALRMRRGADDFSGDPEGLWGFAGLEKG